METRGAEPQRDGERWPKEPPGEAWHLEPTPSRRWEAAAGAWAPGQGAGASKQRRRWRLGKKQSLGSGTASS